MPVAPGQGGKSPQSQIACVYRPPGGGRRTHNPTADRHRPQTQPNAVFHRPTDASADLHRPRTPAQRGLPPPTGASADLYRPLNAERGPLPPLQHRTRTSTAPPTPNANLYRPTGIDPHADRHSNTERPTIPAHNDNPAHLHPNTSDTTPRPQSPPRSNRLSGIEPRSAGADDRLSEPEEPPAPAEPAPLPLTARRLVPRGVSASPTHP
ncbi:hypothetical protein GCM10010437_064110 [Actinoplanes palleronii]